MSWRNDPPTERQLAFLAKYAPCITPVDKGDASDEIDEVISDLMLDPPADLVQKVEQLIKDGYVHQTSRKYRTVAKNDFVEPLELDSAVFALWREKTQKR